MQTLLHTTCYSSAASTGGPAETHPAPSDLEPPHSQHWGTCRDSLHPVIWNPPTATARPGGPSETHPAPSDLEPPHSQPWGTCRDSPCTQ
ncbi:hypothetical protein FKM82_002913 [Ascaphus truei]